MLAEIQEEEILLLAKICELPFLICVFSRVLQQEQIYILTRPANKTYVSFLFG